jgi:hypothetical protein
MGPQDRFSSLEVHDSQRFCGLCLVVHRAQIRVAEVAREKAYRNRPRREKIANFNRMMFGSSDLYSFLPLMLFRIFFLIGLALFVTVSGLIFDWGTGAAVGVIYTFVVWYVGVSLS